MSGSSSKPTNRLKFQQIQKREQNDVFSSGRRKQNSSSKADVSGKFMYSYQQDFYKRYDKCDKMAEMEGNSNNHLKVDSNFKTVNSMSFSKRNQPYMAVQKKPQSARRNFFENEPVFDQIAKLDNQKLNIGAETKKQIMMCITQSKKKFSQLKQPVNKNELQKYIKQLKQIRNRLNQYDSSLAAQDTPLIQIIQKFIKSVEQNRQKVKILSNQYEKNRAEDLKKHNKQTNKYRQLLEQTNKQANNKLKDRNKQNEKLLYMNKQLTKKCQQLQHVNQNLLQLIQNKEKDSKKQEEDARQLFNQTTARNRKSANQIQQVVRQVENSKAKFNQIQNKNQQIDRKVFQMQQMVKQNQQNNKMIDTINKLCEQQQHQATVKADQQQKANADPNLNLNANQTHQNNRNKQENNKQDYKFQGQFESDRQEYEQYQLMQLINKRKQRQLAEKQNQIQNILREIYQRQQILDQKIRQLEANLGIEIFQDSRIYH